MTWFQSVSRATREAAVFLGLLTLLFAVSCRSETTGPEAAQNGSRYRGVMVAEFSPADEAYRVLRQEWNANLVRWPLSTWPATDGTDLAAYDDFVDAELNDLDADMDSFARYGIKAIINLHQLPGGDRNYEPRLLREQQYNDKFISVWRRIATRYRAHPALLGYDLINEPVQHEPPEPGLDLTTTQLRTAIAIREIDPDCVIFIEANNGDDPTGFIGLTPLNLPNLAYEAHMYVPHRFTLQGADPILFPEGDVYPGLSADDIYGEGYYDKEKLLEIFEPVRDFQQRFGAPIYIGEFSAIRWAEGAADYLKHCVEIFEDYGWDWSYHAYKGWDGFDLEYESGTHELVPASEPTDRMQVILDGFAMNPVQDLRR